VQGKVHLTKMGEQNLKGYNREVPVYSLADECSSSKEDAAGGVAQWLFVCLDRSRPCIPVNVALLQTLLAGGEMGPS
jgi:hypothetical protein